MLKRIKMIEPGALIQSGYTGSIAELHEDEPYLRNGMAFPVEMPKNFELTYDN